MGNAWECLQRDDGEDEPGELKQDMVKYQEFRDLSAKVSETLANPGFAEECRMTFRAAVHGGGPAGMRGGGGRGDQLTREQMKDMTKHFIEKVCLDVDMEQALWRKMEEICPRNSHVDERMFTEFTRTSLTCVEAEVSQRLLVLRRKLEQHKLLNSDGRDTPHHNVNLGSAYGVDDPGSSHNRQNSNGQHQMQQQREKQLAMQQQQAQVQHDRQMRLQQMQQEQLAEQQRRQLEEQQRLQAQQQQHPKNWVSKGFERQPQAVTYGAPTGMQASLGDEMTFGNENYQAIPEQSFRHPSGPSDLEIPGSSAMLHVPVGTAQDLGDTREFSEEDVSSMRRQIEAGTLKVQVFNQHLELELKRLALNVDQQLLGIFEENGVPVAFFEVGDLRGVMRGIDSSIMEPDQAAPYTDKALAFWFLHHDGQDRFLCVVFEQERVCRLANLVFSGLCHSLS